MPRTVGLNGKSSRFIVLASVCLVVAALFFAKSVFVPLALAVLLSFLLSPAVRWLEHIRLGRAPSTLIVVCLALALVVSFGFLIANQLKSVVEQLPNYRGELQTKIEGLKRHGGFFRKAEAEIHNIKSAATSTQPAAVVGAPVPQPNAAKTDGAGITPSTHAPTQPNSDNAMLVRLVPAEQSNWDSVASYATKALEPLATSALVIILVIFMLLTRDDLRDRIIRLVGHGRLNLTTQALDEAGSRISRYLGALATVNCVYGACVAGGLWAIGHFFGHGTPFPNVLVWGLLVGLFRFVPYLGIWLGAAVPLLLSFALYSGSEVFIAVVVMFAALEIAVSQFVEPYWYGASTGLSPLAVLVAAVVWTWLWGPIGLLLSTPMTVCVVVIGKYVPQLQFLDILLGDEPVLPPHVRLYQRLIAVDEEEAAELARTYLEDKPLEAVYDEVLVPAPAMAESDRHQDRIEASQLEFIHQSIRDIVEELGDEARARADRMAADATEKSGKDQKGGISLLKAPVPPFKPRPPLPKDCTVNVLCLPARGESDELVAMMVKQLLELRGYCATATSADSLASEMVGMIENQTVQIVCVSAMPPAAVAHARYLCKRIHVRFPKMSMIVGVWLAKADQEKIKQRIACAQEVLVVTTLGQTQEQIDQMAQSFIVRGAPAQEPAVAV